MATWRFTDRRQPAAYPIFLPKKASSALAAASEASTSNEAGGGTFWAARARAR
jgi:hypothetical protein